MKHKRGTNLLSILLSLVLMLSLLPAMTLPASATAFYLCPYGHSNLEPRYENDYLVGY